MFLPGIRRIYIYIALALTLLMIAVSMTDFGRRLATGVFSYFIQGANSVAGWVDSRFRDVAPGQESDSEKITRLEGRVAELESISASARLLKEENNQLRRLLGLNAVSGWKAVTAEIIARDPATWFTSFTINRGERDGLREGYAVVANSYIIGRIGKCRAHFSEVYTIMSPECRFSVRIDGTESIGGCVGQGGQEGCFIDYVPKNIDVHHGQKILTSGLGGWMPDGLQVGTLKAFDDGVVKHIQEDTRCQLLMAPYSDFERVRFVSVLVR